MPDGTSKDFPAISPNGNLANANVVNKRDPTLSEPGNDQIPDLKLFSSCRTPRMILSPGLMKIP
jgi:hypothetical protein